jgi:rhamnosyl/mannosyltransferase
MTPVHILHIYKDYYPVLGGIENHLRTLAEGLAARGQRITVLVTNTAARDEIEHSGSLTVIKAGRLLHAASTPLSARMVQHARALRDVDMVHLHFPFPPGDLVAQAVPGSPPLVVSYHSDIVRQRTLLRLYGPLLRRTLARARAIIATSPPYIKSSPWLRPHQERCTSVPYGIDMQRFTSSNPGNVAALQARYGTPLLLFVGQLRYYKGLHFLLDALPRMQTQARLLLVGKGPEEPRLREQVRANGLQERVTFVGEMPNEQLPDLYRAAEVFVLPSHLRSEAFGIVQIEAQAAGLPCLSTELGTGTSYINQHGVTGFVVPPADPPALARALDVLLANPLVRRRMGEQAQQRATREFTHRRMIERIEQLYDSL